MQFISYMNRCTIQENKINNCFIHFTHPSLIKSIKPYIKPLIVILTLFCSIKPTTPHLTASLTAHLRLSNYDQFHSKRVLQLEIRSVKVCQIELVFTQLQYSIGLMNVPLSVLVVRVSTKQIESQHDEAKILTARSLTKVTLLIHSSDFQQGNFINPFVNCRIFRTEFSNSNLISLFCL